MQNLSFELILKIQSFHQSFIQTQIFVYFVRTLFASIRVEILQDCLHISFRFFNLFMSTYFLIEFLITINPIPYKTTKSVILIVDIIDRMVFKSIISRFFLTMFGLIPNFFYAFLEDWIRSWSPFGFQFINLWIKELSRKVNQS